MTGKERIKAEVERLKDIQSSPIALCNDLISFIDSLPEESASKDLEEAANDYAHDIVRDDVFETFIAGAQWQKSQLIDKACEWLKGVLYVEERYSPDGDFVESDARSVEEFINEFRKAMENKK